MPVRARVARRRLAPPLPPGRGGGCARPAGWRSVRPTASAGGGPRGPAPLRDCAAALAGGGWARGAEGRGPRGLRKRPVTSSPALLLSERPRSGRSCACCFCSCPVPPSLPRCVPLCYGEGPRKRGYSLACLQREESRIRVWGGIRPISAFGVLGVAAVWVCQAGLKRLRRARRLPAGRLCRLLRLCFPRGCAVGWGAAGVPGIAILPCLPGRSLLLCQA